MIRGKFIIDKETGKLVPYGKQEKEIAPEIITDEIPGGLKSMVNGKIYTSKYRLREHYRQVGVTEIGNETNFSYKYNMYEDHKYKKQLEEDAHRAYYEARDGMAPLSELDKERCAVIDRNLEHYNYDRRERDESGKPRN